MACKFYSKIVLAFTICLMPFFLYGIEREEALQYKNLLMTTKKSIEHIGFTGQCLCAAGFISSLSLALVSEAESSNWLFFNSTFYSTVLSIVLLSLVKVEWDLEEKLAELRYIYPIYDYNII